MRRALIQLVTLAAFSMVPACTNLQEQENIPTGLTTDIRELMFSESSGTKTIVVVSGIRWNVSGTPSWLSVQSIDSRMASSYEWTLSLAAEANDGYDREGVLNINAGGESVDISVEQKGKKGKYVAVESVSVSPSELTLTEGETKALTTSILPANASEKGLSWTSSNSSVAVVSSPGEVTAKAVGKTTITVKTDDGAKTATCEVTVNPVSVNSITLNQESLTLRIGESSTLTATILPENAANKKVSWSSSNTSIATVDSDGKVMAHGIGSASITVTTEDGGKTAVCQVLVKEPSRATSLTLLGADFLYSAKVGKEFTISVDVKPEDAFVDLEWSVSDESLAEISEEGSSITLRAKDYGPSTLMVRDKISGLSASEQMVAGLLDFYWTENTGKTYNGCPLVEIEVGEKRQLNCYYQPEYATRVFRSDMKGFRYYEPFGDNTEVSNIPMDQPSFFSIDENGTITGKKVGLTRIQVYSPIILNNAQDLYVRVISKPIPVTGVSLDVTNITLTEGGSHNLYATITPSNATDQAVIWSSSNASVATVSNSGLVTAKAVGTATITVTTNDGGKKATCSVLVSQSSPGTIDGHKYVEMGNGLKWATMNIGASTETEQGDYFAWGETEPYYSSLYPLVWRVGKEGGYELSSYRYYSDNEYNKYIIYSWTYTDGLSTLEEIDDAAAVNWGGTWRMPTDEEWATLRNEDNYTWTWTDNYHGTGVQGCIVTSKMAGFKDNSIFLPAGGDFIGTTLYYKGIYGYYWSSSLNTSSTYNSEAVGSGFGSTSQFPIYAGRRTGHPIRAVSE